MTLWDTVFIEEKIFNIHTPVLVSARAVMNAAWIIFLKTLKLINFIRQLHSASEQPVPLH